MADSSDDETQLTSFSRQVWNLRTAPAFLALADQAIISASNFATNIIVGRSVSDRDFSAYILAMSLLYMAKGAQETLVASPFVVFRQRKRGPSIATYRGSNAVYQLATTLAVVIGIPLLALILAWTNASPTLIRAGLIMLAAAPFLMLREYLRRISFAEFRFSVALGMDVTITSLQLGLLAALWHFGKLSALLAFAAIGLSCLVGSLLWLARRPVAFKFDRKVMLSDWSDDFVFGRWAFMTFVFGLSTPYIMPWLLGFYRGDTAVARFGAAQTIVGLANMFVLGVNNLLGPLAARSYAIGGGAKLLRTLSKTCMVFVVSLGSFCGVLWLLGDSATNMAFDGKYEALRNTMVMLGAAMLFGSLKMTGGSGLSAMHKPKLNLPADFMMLFVALAAGVPLTIRFAEAGTAAGMAIGAAAACGVRWLTLFNCLRTTVDAETSNREPEPRVESQSDDAAEDQVEVTRS